MYKALVGLGLKSQPRDCLTVCYGITQFLKADAGIRVTVVTDLLSLLLGIETTFYLLIKVFYFILAVHHNVGIEEQRVI
jgi:hypothetical protein